MSNNSIFEKNKILIKGFFIGFLILLMLIPKFMVQGLVNERASLQKQATDEISKKWANAQTVVGPILVVPYRKYKVKSNQETIVTHHTAYILPEKLNVDGQVIPEEKKRSIYHVSLYRSHLTLSGRFSNDAISKLGIDSSDIDWSNCKLLVGISDARGLEDEVALDWNGKKHLMEPTLDRKQIFGAEMVSSIDYRAATSESFNIKLKVKGSTHLHFAPVGKTTSVELASKWEDPSFDGYYLPDTSSNEKGFKARWNILQGSRSFPQYWDANSNTASMKIYDNSFGVKLIQPADHYIKTERSVKYAILIIGLTFVVFFFVEIMQKVRIHPLQYILVGIALIVFYTLLLSISEYTGFNIAYLIAAIATVTLIGSYVWSVVKKGKVAAGFTFSLAALYTYLFMLIQLEEYALISGSIGLFVILALIMFYSRRIDWYNTGKQISEAHE